MDQLCDSSKFLACILYQNFYQPPLTSAKLYINVSKYLKYLLICYLFIPIFTFNFLIYSEQQFVYLANAFLKGSFSFVQLPSTIADLSFFSGKYFWPLGPLPALILTPFVWLFGLNFQENYIKFPLTIFNFLLVLKICQKLKLQTEKAKIVAIFFIFGSIYTPVATIPYSSYFAHVVATSLILIAIYEFLDKKRWFVIGTTVALAMLTRLNLAVAVLFFILNLFKKPLNYWWAFKLIGPIICGLLLLTAYNYQRFGNIFESGYRYQLIPKESMTRREQGLFSAKHIPTNLYYMLIKTPDPVLVDNSHVLKAPFLKFDPYGMSLFFMSPLLFLIFKAKLNDRLAKISLITVGLMLIPLILYYGIGWRQIGYRYALDFMPFLLIPLVQTVRKVSTKTIVALTMAGIIITWFFIIEMIQGY